MWGKDGAVAVLEEDDVAGVVEDAGDVGGHEVFAIADADDGGRAGARSDELVRLVRGEDADGEGAGEAFDGAADGFFEGQDHGADTRLCRRRCAHVENGFGLVGLRHGDRVRGTGGCAFQGGDRNAVGDLVKAGAVELVLNEVGNDFGIGFRDEVVAAADELGFEGEIIFDDPVVHDDKGAGAVAVGVGVLLRGSAVGVPAGVADAVGALQRALTQDGLQVAELAGGAADIERGGVGGIAGDGDAGGVIAAVLQAAQAFHDKGNDRLGTNITDDATHSGSVARKG